MVKLLREIEGQRDTGKTIIFSEFVKMLDVVAGILEEERIRFVRCTSAAPIRSDDTD